MASIQVQKKPRHQCVQRLIDSFILTMTNSLAKQDRTSCQSLTTISSRFPSNSASSFCGKLLNTPLNASLSLQPRSKYHTVSPKTNISNLYRPSSLILSNPSVTHTKKPKSPIPRRTATKHSQTMSTFQYIPACDSLIYKRETKKARSATVSHQ